MHRSSISNSLAKAAVLLAALAACGANGHMVMNTPEPFDSTKVSSSPLAGSLTFPCQGLTGVGSVAKMQAGGTQLVKFTGSAVHGGGSCQFSVNYNYDPTNSKPDDWKTIYTVIGGCPAEAAGNLPSGPPDVNGRPTGPECGNDTGKECVRQFEVPVPKGLKSGNATFAWTWFNKIGNREMYMNCAPVEITGGAADDSFVDSLPSIFVANIDSKTPCVTGDGVLNIPNPGAFGVVNDQPSAGSNGGCASAPPPSFGGGAGNSTAAAPAPASSPAASSSSTGIVLPSPLPTAATVANNPPTTLQTTVTGTSPAVPMASSALPPYPTQASSSGGGSGNSPQACSPDGSIICIGAAFFGICDHGRALPQPLAAGTTCTNGQIARRAGSRFRGF